MAAGLRRESDFRPLMMVIAQRKKNDKANENDAARFYSKFISDLVTLSERINSS
jgi:hypothetical protein